MENTQQPVSGETQIYSVDAPVLLIGFNRPDETSAVIARLREVKPKTIYFAVDGAREGRTEEAQLVTETRALASAFDWGCKVSTRFSEVNQGCGLGVSSAISWALETEEQVIVLEDDIVPVVSFFRYCDELLELYKDHKDVFSISGCNFVPEEVLSSPDSYRFSSIPNVWGWAVWKRSWESYSYDMNNWRDKLPLGELKLCLGGSLVATFMFSRIFDLVAAKKIDTWDYQLMFAVLKARSLVVSPNMNLTENIGFGVNATHTAIAPPYMLETNEVTFPLRHPVKQVSIDSDRWTLVHAHGGNVRSVGKSALWYLLKGLRQKFHRQTQ
jgi:hypothetical protein